MLEEVIMYTFQQCVYYISKVCACREGSSIPWGWHKHPQRLLHCAGFFKLLHPGSCTTLRCFPLG